MAALYKRNREYSPLRLLPNIFVTGTTGVGKSTLCKRLLETNKLTWMEVSRIGEENDFFEYCTPHADACKPYCLDNYYYCPFIVPEKVSDYMEYEISRGGTLVDYNHCFCFEYNWFDIVIILRTDITILQDRLTARGYTEKQLKIIIEREMYDDTLKEARDIYETESVYEFTNTTPENLENILERINQMIRSFTLETRRKIKIRKRAVS